MQHQTSLTDMMLSTPVVMSADEPMRYARRRMQSEALHSIIIVQDNRPVGIVEARHLRGVTADDLSRPVSDFMTQGVPVLRSETPPDEAVNSLGHDVEIDQFPVVRDDGTLAGVVTRETLLRYRDHGAASAHVEHATMTDPVSAQTGAARVADTHFDLHQGMSVEDAEGSNLGSISNIIVDHNGRVQSFNVEHGLIFKHQKRLTVDLIQRVDGDTAHVILTSTDFKMIPDVDDSDQA